MSYIYSLLGITTWVVAVALSSNALIAHENNVLSKEVARKVEVISNQQKTNTTLNTGNGTEPSRAVSQTSVVSEKPSVTQTTKEPYIRKGKAHEEEEDDDED